MSQPMSAVPIAPVDIDAAVRFVKSIHGHERAGFAILMLKRGGLPPSHYGFDLGNPQWDVLRRVLTNHMSGDCYIGVALYAAPPQPGKNRTKDMVLHCHWLWCERDNHALPDTLPKPTFTIETSAGNSQDWWRMDAPLSLSDAEDYAERIAGVVGCAPMKDATRVLRIVGLKNHKPERHGEIARIADETGAVYSLGDFAHLPRISAPAVSPRESGPRGTIGEGYRHHELLSLAGSLRRRGLSRDMIFAALREMNDTQCDPPKPDAEIEKIANDASGWEPAPVAPVRIARADVTPLRPNRVDPETGEVIPRFPLTDYGNAERLVHHHGNDLRYCHPFGKWLVWDGTRWALDNTAEVIRRAKATARNLLHEAADEPDDSKRKDLTKHAIKSEGEARIRAMIALAESELSVPVLPDDLDANPWLLNVATGTLDLRTGNLREHRRADLITKLAPVAYEPDATCPTFDAFLAQILPSEPLRQFVQRATGYSLTGDTREDVIFINYGTGSNGKSTLMSTLLDILGDYAMQTPTEMLMVRRSDGIPNDVARLKGARFVGAAEAEEGRRLAEGLVKQLTGGDRISARFMRGEWFDFEPDFKLWLSTNHKPIIRGTDNGIWRRLRLIPYTVTIPEEQQDEGMSDKLRAEAAGILAWMVRGCLDWQRNKLGMPDEVKKANAEYRAEMDVLGNWIGDCCIEGFNMLAPSGKLYESYQAWCTENGERTISSRAFGLRLMERGYTDKKGTGGVRQWLGIGLLTTPKQDELVAQVAQVAQFSTLARESRNNSVNPKYAPLAPLAPLDNDDDFAPGIVGKPTGLIE